MQAATSNRRSLMLRPTKRNDMHPAWESWPLGTRIVWHEGVVRSGAPFYAMQPNHYGRKASCSFALIITARKSNQNASSAHLKRISVTLANLKPKRAASYARALSAVGFPLFTIAAAAVPDRLSSSKFGPRCMGDPYRSHKNNTVLWNAQSQLGKSPHCFAWSMAICLTDAT